MASFTEKNVVVTGAGSGIGRAVALAFAEAGANVVCSDINPETAAATAREVVSAGVKGQAITCDVSRSEEMNALAEASYSALGSVDVLVNNAGVALAGPVEHLSLDDWAWQLGPNLFGVIHGVHAFLPGMLARGSGHIVNIASAAGLVAMAGMTAYCTTKFAVVGLSEALRFETAHRGVNVTAVCPGFVTTGIFDAARSRGGMQLRQRALMRIAIKPEDLAAQILDGVARNRPRIVATGHALALFALKSRLPGVYDRLGMLMGQAVMPKS